MIYPNPVGEELVRVQAPEGRRIAEVTVYSALGQVVVNQATGDRKRTAINLAGLPAGQYWVRTRYASGRAAVSGVVRK